MLAYASENGMMLIPPAGESPRKPGISPGWAPKADGGGAGNTLGKGAIAGSGSPPTGSIGPAGIIGTPYGSGGTNIGIIAGGGSGGSSIG